MGFIVFPWHSYIHRVLREHKTNNGCLEEYTERVRVIPFLKKKKIISSFKCSSMEAGDDATFVLIAIPCAG